MSGESNNLSTVRNIIIRDQRIAKSTRRGKGKPFLAMVRDPVNRKYISKAHDSLTHAKLWANVTLAKVTLHEESALKADWLAAGREYVKKLAQKGRSKRHVDEVSRVVEAVGEAGAKDMKSPGFLGIVRSWVHAGKTFATDRVNHPVVSDFVKQMAAAG